MKTIFTKFILTSPNYKQLNQFANLILRHYSSYNLGLSDFQREALIGLILGDLHISRLKITHNTRLMFKQSYINSSYLVHLYTLYCDYCLSEPKFKKYYDKRTNKIYYSIYFNTRMLSIFNYYHSLFYINGVKTIPSNIGELLTPIGLAYWAMDDGNKNKKNFYLNTDSLSLDEVQLLIKVLKDNFDLDCTFHVKRKGQYRIFIQVKSMDRFRSLVYPYFHPSMYYKLKI